MKYLRTINEILISKDLLKEFCEDYLANILDINGFELDIETGESGENEITIDNPEGF